MRVVSCLAFLFVFVAGNASAAKLSDYEPFAYEVKFTNPKCAELRYAQPVPSVSGKPIAAKPRSYCKEEDALASALRPTSPQFALVQWILDPATDEIFFANSAFLSGRIARELCRAIEERDVKVRFVLDEDADIEQAQELMSCRPLSGRPERNPSYVLRGGSDSMGRQSVKFFLINPQSDTEVRIAFSGGDLAQGLVLSHEAWHFVTTSPATYFAQAHVCLMNGLLNAGSSKTEFARYINACRAKIQAPEEEDARAFFLPGDAARALSLVDQAAARAKSISLAADRFAEGKLSGILRAHAAKSRLLLDDGIFWAARGLNVSDNASDEGVVVDALVNAGASMKYMETNHEGAQVAGGKYVLFESDTGSAVFLSSHRLSDFGSGNDYENAYLISVPAAVTATRVEFQALWDGMGTQAGDMPSVYIAL